MQKLAEPVITWPLHFIHGWPQLLVDFIFTFLGTLVSPSTESSIPQSVDLSPWDGSQDPRVCAKTHGWGYCWQVDEYFNCIEFNFSNTGAYGGLYTRLSQLSWHLQKHPTHSSRRFQHDLTVARPCYVTETEYSPRFHEIPWVSICWIDAFPSSSEHFHEVPTDITWIVCNSEVHWAKWYNVFWPHRTPQNPFGPDPLPGEQKEPSYFLCEQTGQADMVDSRSMYHIGPAGLVNRRQVSRSV